MFLTVRLTTTSISQLNLLSNRLQIAILSGADASSSIVLTAGIAEVAAGAISMRLGGYLAAKSKADHYTRELKREKEEITAVPDTEATEVAEMQFT